MTTALIVAAAWLAVAMPVALVLGRAISAADHQEQEVRRPHLTLVA